ncbi:Efr3 [Kluyveromyces lactis]|nr:Efr3 [Kluyveromyces lactis]
MGFLFTPKHQKLVNQCYPPGRTPDKKPKGSETSYLLYYVNSRRPKLEKVSSYLVKRSTTDLNRRRSGNVSVTLELLAKIVENCNENMNIFIKDFIHIMTLVLNNNNFNNDPTIVGLIERVLEAICNHLDGSLVSGDSEFLELFKNFITLYFKVANTKLNDTDLVLKGCLDFSKISNLGSIHQWSATAKNCVSIALTKFQERHPIYGEATIDSSFSEPGSPALKKKLTRTQTKVMGLDDVSNTEDYSILALNTFFNTTETDKLTISLHALIEHLLETPNKELLQFICNGIPVQLRYIVILLFVRPLGTSSEKNMLLILKLISSLLTSVVSIIGLSVIDILRRLITVQLAKSDSTTVVKQIAVTIKDLNRKTYYKQQSSDMFTELSFKFIENGKPHHLDLFQLDLDSLISVTSDQCLDLDLFAEFLPYVTDKTQLSKLLYPEAPHQVIFIRFFEKVSALSKQDTEIAISTSFAYYKAASLLSGLAYYVNNNRPSNGYYAYHHHASKFLGLADYQTQVEFKRKENDTFTKEDLLNYYSDAGSNIYSEKGRDILLVDHSDQNGTDIDQDTVRYSTPIPLPQISIPPTTISGIGIKKSSPANDTYVTRSLKHNPVPNVKDLKNLVSSKKDKSNTKTLRGSQSVKSKVTNITFLLDELKNDGDEIKIADPDEEDIIGMEKQDLARSYSLRMNTISSTNSRTLIPSVENVKEHDDDFRDAHEDIEVSSSTRGRLFMA